MARPRKQTYTMKQYLENVDEGYISNDADTQRFPAWKAIIDGLAVTVLTDDYIPPIILAEEDNGQIYITDGGSRTAALKMIYHGNYKIKSSVEDPIIKYKSVTKDENGEITWNDAEFDIGNKTFEQFPKELKKKFEEYQIETVIHEHCDKEKIAKYIKRYNEHSSMNASQKMFIYVHKFANKIRKIANRQFFINNSNFTNNEKDKGILERVISESIMCMFHLDKWNKNGKKIAKYLNQNACDEEFNRLNNNLERLENIITDDIKEIFNSKDSFVWLTLFNGFIDIGIEDIKFVEFLRAFKNGLKNKSVDGKLFDTVDETGSTKDKRVIEDKLHILETLMKEYLHIETVNKSEADNENNKEEIKNDNVEEVNNEEVTDLQILNFVKENVNPNIIEDDIGFHNDNLKAWTVGIPEKSKLNDIKNKPSMIALAAYAFENDELCDDETMIEWFANYESKNKTYLSNQKENFLHMKDDLNKYIMKGAA